MKKERKRNKSQANKQGRNDSVFRMLRPTCTWADEVVEQQFHEFLAEFAHLSVAWQQCE